MPLKTFHSIQDFVCPQKTIITLGTFDGVHVGHKKIISNLIQQAKAGNFQSVLLTFFPHPRLVLQADSDIRLLNSIEEKTYLLEKAGLENLVIHPFDKTFSELSAEAFVAEILVKKLNIHKIIIGHDHRFGKNRTANFVDLVAYGKKYGFEVEQISAKEINEVSVSSTKIRNALKEGDITLANKYLGYPYSFSGNVVAGKKLGRTINFPTANIELVDQHKLLPKNGVYTVRVTLSQQSLFGMMNIGNNPTVGGTTRKIEINLFNFNNDIYKQNATVEVLHFLRDEQKFASLEHLKNQLIQDKTDSLAFLQSYQTI